MLHMSDPVLSMNYHQFTSTEFRALAKHLRKNKYVQVLKLDGNWMDELGMKYLSSMIRYNNYITELVNCLNA